MSSLAGPDTTDLEALLRDASASVARLAVVWRRHDPDEWRAAPHLYEALARRFSDAGDPVLAHEVLKEALAWGGWGRRLEHFYGLVLARSGATARAAEVARRLSRSVVDDPAFLADVLGLLARTEKDMGLRATSVQARRRHLRRARAVYRAAWRRTRQSYPAINAATMALLLGRDDEAAALAVEARTLAGEELSAGQAAGRPVYWQEATLAEAALLLGDGEEAERRYRTAATAAAGRLADLAAMQRQARLILAARDQPAGWLEDAFGLPRVAVFVGQLPGAPAPGREAMLAARLRERLDTLRIGFGYAAASAGSEIMFLEAVQARGGQTEIVLPYARDEFVRRRVDVVPGWRDRFERIAATSRDVLEATRAGGGSISREYAALLLAGLAGMQSQQLDTPLVVLAVWDGSDAADSPAATIRAWQAQGHAVEILDGHRA